MSFDPTCRKCHAPIRWCRTTNGRMMPLDQEPDPTGNVICEYQDGTLVGKVLTRGDPRPAGVAFMPHFATCPARAKRKQGTPKKQPKPKPEPAPSLFDQPQGETK